MTGSETPLVELRGVSKTFRRRGSTVVALRDLSLTVGAGETVGLIGESGSGKSTTGRLILGLETPDSGEILFRGVPTASMTRSQRKEMRTSVQVVFQEPFESLNPRLKVGSIVAEPLVIRGIGDRDSRRARVLETLERVGLPAGLAARYPGELSGGQQQRVGIARAIVGDPSVLVLDEPTASLDRTIRRQISAVLRDLQVQLNLGYLLITHDMGTVRRVADRAIVLLQGALVEEGPVAEIMANPREDYSRLLIGSELRAEPPARPRAEKREDAR